jgi:KTSC domain
MATTPFVKIVGRNELMEWYEVDSSNVAAIGYDPEEQKCRVIFKNKAGHKTATWDYWPVSRDVLMTIVEAVSVGAAVNRHLVKGGIDSRKVE